MAMFESLDETIRRDQQKTSTPQQRITLYAGVAIAAAGIITALCLSLQFLL
jgi:hypothetical protein